MGVLLIHQINMKLVFLMITAVFAASIDRDDENLEDLADGMSPFGHLDEDEFLEIFNLPSIDDPEEKEKRAETLKEHEKEVLENNEAYLAGNQTWWDEINEYSDLTDEEFDRGLINKPLPYDEESERFFDGYRYSRSSVPASYNSVTLGNVSPVKHQGSCGSCVAFATMALVETCFKKEVGVFGDYSEQHFVDCAYDGIDVSGCNGATLQGYAKWLKEKSPKLAHETTYPYKATQQTCPPPTSSSTKECPPLELTGPSLVTRPLSRSWSPNTELLSPEWQRPDLSLSTREESLLAVTVDRERTTQ